MTTSSSTSKTTNNMPGSSAACPIVIPPPISSSSSSGWNQSQRSDYVPVSETQFDESFAWPSLWFDLASLSSSTSTLTSRLPPSTQKDSLCSDPLPDLIPSKTPDADASPLSLHDMCTTPSPTLSHMSSPNIVSICDVPLVAPRPLPFTPPLFLQFDSLPEQDEDLSFPPYTRSKRIPSDAPEKQKPKRPAAVLLSNTNANTVADVGALGGGCYDAIECESQYQYRDASVPKRRKISAAANSGDSLQAASGGIENIRPCIQAQPSMNGVTNCNTNANGSTYHVNGRVRSRPRMHMSMCMRNVRNTGHLGFFNGKVINEHVDPYQLHMNEISRNQYWDHIGSVLPFGVERGGGRLNMWNDNHGVNGNAASGCDAMSVRNGWNEVIGAGVVGVGPASVGWV